MLKRATRAAGLAGLCMATGVAVAEGPLRRWDERAFRAMNRDGGPVADRVFAGMTELGSIWASAGAAGVLVAAGFRRAASRSVLAASATWVAGQALKKLFVQDRPYHAEGDGVRLLSLPPRGTSWPSSHAGVFLAFATVAGRELGLPRPARRILGGMGAVVGVSRAYVGVHYPADVVGGLLMGRAIAEAMAADRI